MKGFSLIEVLIVIGLTLILVAAAVPLYGNLQISTQLNEESAMVAQTIRTAQEQSVAGLNSSRHGVKFEANKYTLFSGSSYAVRNIAYDAVFNLSQALAISTTLVGDEVVFTTGQGMPDNIGSITITHTIDGSRVISVNELGRVWEQ